MRMNRYCPAAAKINTCQSKRSNSLGSAFYHIFFQVVTHNPAWMCTRNKEQIR